MHQNTQNNTHTFDIICAAKKKKCREKKTALFFHMSEHKLLFIATLHTHTKITHNETNQNKKSLNNKFYK